MNLQQLISILLIFEYLSLKISKKLNIRNFNKDYLVIFYRKILLL